MADIEKVKQAAKLCTECNGVSCRKCPYDEHNNGGVGVPMCGVVFATDVLSVIDKLQAEIERLCNKIGVMKESIEDSIMSETVFDTFDDLSSYVNAERCRSEEWTGGIRDAIQAVRAWGE